MAAGVMVDGARDRLMRLFLAVVICFPFDVYLPLASFLSLVVGCGGALLCARRLPWPPLALGVSAVILVGYLGFQVAAGADWRRCLGTSNHMVQWLFATYAFYTAFHNGAFALERLPRFLPYLVFGHVLAAGLLAAGIGQQPWEANPLFYEHNLLSFFVIFCLCRLAATPARRRALLLLFVYITTLTVLTDRASLMALNVMVLGVCFFRVRPELVAGFAVLVLAFPVMSALTLSDTGLARLVDVDFNTYIRMEFIRGAASMLADHLATGVGFDTMFRPLSYPYLQPHPLLNDPDFTGSVSNHHSIFDTVLRLGVVMGPVFIWPILRQLHVPSQDRSAQVGILFQAFGLSFNAYFEQQGQISTVAFITAMLLVMSAALAARRPRAVAGAGLPATA